MSSAVAEQPPFIGPSSSTDIVRFETFFDDEVLGSDLVIDLVIHPPKPTPKVDIYGEAGTLIPRDYQLYGRDWLRKKRRGMCTDQAGLGKTLTAIIAAADELPCLVVCPKYLVTQWYDAIKAQYPRHKVALAAGRRQDREAALRSGAKWTIINTDMLRTYVIPNVERYRTVIYDEFHHLRNRKAAKSRAAFLLTKNENVRVFGLTASPMWKNVDDLWMQLHILQPKIFTSYNEFVDQFCIVDRSSPYGMKVLGIRSSMKEDLDELLGIVCLGRTYSDVGRSLPRTILSTLRVDFPVELRKKYAEIQTRFRIEAEEADERGDKAFIPLSAASMMHTLRQVTAFPGKIEAVRDLLEDINRPAVVFTWYRDHAEAVSAAIPNSTCITGELDAEDRHFLAMKAQREKRTIVATLSSLSEGVNLQQYRAVVFFEQNWPPGSNYQALSRVVRDRNEDAQGGGANDSSQDDPVLVYHVMVPRTVDEVIYNVTKRREATIRGVMDEILRPI